MSIVEKISSIKNKTESFEEQIQNLNKAINEMKKNYETKLKEIYSIISQKAESTKEENHQKIKKDIEELNIKLENLSKKTNTNYDIDKKIQEIYKNVETKIKEFSSELESQFNMLDQKLKVLYEKVENKSKEKETKTKEAVDLTQMKNELSNCSITIKEIEKTISSLTKENEKLNSENLSKFSKIKEYIDNLDEKLKQYQKNKDELLINFGKNLEKIEREKDLQNVNLKELQKTVQKLIENPKTNPVSKEEFISNIGHLKTDIVTTESKIRSDFEALRDEINQIKIDNQKFINQNKEDLQTDFQNKIDTFEKENIERIGKLYNEISEIQNLIRQIGDKKESNIELENEIKEIKNMLTQKEKQNEIILSQLNEEFSQNTKGDLELSDKVKKLILLNNSIQKEIKTLKEQVIITQDAIVEINRFIREILKY